MVSVRLRANVPFDPTGLERNFYTSSSCGVCGKASIEAVEVKGCAPLPLGDLRIDGGVIDALPDALRSSQSLFDRTGGLHAAGLFDDVGVLELAREDVGRHNAVDKVIGAGFLNGGVPFAGRILVVSGRTSFEILQKTVAAAIPMVVAVGAPSSLAVELAREFNVTLIGFARGGGFNVYTSPQRVLDWGPETP